MSAVVCEPCGEVYFRSTDIADFELQVAFEAGRRGFVHGPAFRFMRSAIGLSTREIARLLDVTAETVRRWENGHSAIPRANFVVVSAMIEDHINKRTDTRDRLEAAQYNQEVPDQIAVRGAE
jgi:predicted transcriptional regulator